jgi:hypothetical protein
LPRINKRLKQLLSKMDNETEFNLFYNFHPAPKHLKRLTEEFHQTSKFNRFHLNLED